MKQGYEIINYNLGRNDTRFIFVDNYPTLNRVTNYLLQYQNFNVDNFTVAVFKIKPKTVK